MRGRGDDRVSVSLGPCPEADARRAVDRANAAELEDGGSDRLVTLARLDLEAARRWALDDSPADELGAELPRRYWPLRRYQAEVWWPVRTGVVVDHRSPAVAPNTQRVEEGYWRQILSVLGDLRLVELSAHEWDRYLATRASSPKTWSRHQAAYRALLVYAHRIGDLPHVHEHFRLHGSTKRVRPVVAPLEPAEVLALLEHAPSPMHAAAWAVGIGVGLRPTELLRMCWEDVSGNLETLAVRGTKTLSSAAVVPLTPFARRHLRAWWVRCGQPASGLVWTWRGQPVSSMKRSLATAAEAAGIDRPVTPYLLRHTFATLAWASGVDRDTARRGLRHTDTRMLDEVYARPTPADLARRLETFTV